MMDEKEFEQRQDEILKDIPQEFHSAVTWHAWDRGHSSGYESVLSCVADLVDLLKEPIAEYTARLIKNR